MELGRLVLGLDRMVRGLELLELEVGKEQEQVLFQGVLYHELTGISSCVPSLVWGS